MDRSQGDLTKMSWWSLLEGQRRREVRDRATAVRGRDTLMVRRGGRWITIGESLTGVVEGDL